MGQHDEFAQEHKAELARERESKAKAKVDQERRRLAREQADAQRWAEQGLLLNKEYDELIAAYDQEGERIGKELTDDHWSRAVFRTFDNVKPHWWSAKQTMKLACLELFQSPNGWKFWIREDNKVFLSKRDGSLLRPDQYYTRISNAETMENQLKNMRVGLNKVKDYQVPT